ncbi:MAG TPA: sigma-70 family RNA polymerase sigma factor [Polyangiaceae bacterium]|jgi:RNA polymerase sigma-70 factor (ECF subfamily)|nr:sigma-70 family RNA polymerase sigma factor [Polyangiaceae bacterium]
MRLRLVGVPAKKDPTSAVDPLAALSRAAAVGDARAIDTLLLSVTPAMLRAVRGVLGGDHREIEDVLQEAAIGLVRAMKTFRGEGTVLHFACRIAVLSALAARRRLREHGKEPLEVPEGLALASIGSSPLDLALAVRRRTILRDLCDALPPAQSEALILHCVLGFTVEEIADAAQVPPNTVRSRLRLAKEALRARIVADPALREALESEP